MHNDQVTFPNGHTLPLPPATVTAIVAARAKYPQRRLRSLAGGAGGYLRPLMP